MGSNPTLTATFYKMHKFKIDEWVNYTQFPDAQSESLREHKRAVILELWENGQYIIWIDDERLDIKWRRKRVNEDKLSPID